MPFSSSSVLSKPTDLKLKPERLRTGTRSFTIPLLDKSDKCTDFSYSDLIALGRQTAVNQNFLLTHEK